MNTDTPAVLGALRDSLDGVTMHTPVERIVTAGRTRRRRRRMVGAAVSVAAVTGIAVGVPVLGHPSTAPPKTGLSTVAGSAHIHTAAFSLDSHTDGTIHVIWDKKRTSEDHEGLQRALRAAGFPVLIKEGVFCKGPQDDGYLSPSGDGRGVERVVRGERQSGGGVHLIFNGAAMPAGKQLFVGYLSPAQLAITHGSPGTVFRLVPTAVPLTCDTKAPPSHYGDNGPVKRRG